MTLFRPMFLDVVEAYVASWIEIDLTERPTIPAGVEAYVASWIEID